MKKEDKLFILKPRSLIKFHSMKEWKEIQFNGIEQEAYDIFLKRINSPENTEITKENNPVYLISYLRYDFKKILLRLRKIYIDDNLKTNNILVPPAIGCAFFEALLLCLCSSETFGSFKYNQEKKDVLFEALHNDIPDYSLHAKMLVKYFRNGLAHNLRPYGGFHINFNTRTLYKPPHIFKFNKSNVLRINIQHFIDSIIIALENYILDLQGTNSNRLVLNYNRFLKQRNKELKKLINKGIKL